MSLIQTLIQASDSVLVVIDVQDAFLDKLALAAPSLDATSAPPPDAATLVNRITWIVQLAQVLDIPMIVTAEDVPVLGGVTAALQDRIHKHVVVHNKMIFNMADNPEIMQDLHATGRQTAILVGLETDVCIAQSAMGLVASGYQVAVVQDAVASPGVHHGYGLERMRHTGQIALTNVKGLYFEWMRTVKADNQFKAKHLDRMGTPLGIIL